MEVQNVHQYMQVLHIFEGYKLAPMEALFLVANQSSNHMVIALVVYWLSPYQTHWRILYASCELHEGVAKTANTNMSSFNPRVIDV